MPAVYADLTTLAQTLSVAGKNADLAIAGVIRASAYEIQNDAQHKAPVRTGALRSSISVTFSGPLTAVIGPGVDYGVYQEFGTRGPYEIRPRKPGGLLVFQVNGTTVYARKVTHPGLKAHPYMRPAAKDVLGPLTDKVGKIGVTMIVEPDA